MVVFDIGFAFVASGVLGWRARGQRPALSLTYAGLGVLAPGLAFLTVYPAWDWQYLVDPATLPSGVGAVFAVSVLGAALAGHRVGARHPRVLVGSTILFGIYSLLSIPRMLRVGTFEQWTAGEAPWVGMEFVLFALPWMVMSGVVLGICLWQCEQTRRQAPP